MLRTISGTISLIFALLSIANAQAPEDESEAALDRQISRDFSACLADPVDTAACLRVIDAYFDEEEQTAEGIRIQVRLSEGFSWYRFGLASARLGRLETARVALTAAANTAYDAVIDRNLIIQALREVEEVIAESSAGSPGLAHLEEALELYNNDGDPADMVRLVSEAISTGLEGNDYMKVALQIRQQAYGLLLEDDRRLDDIETLQTMAETESDRALVQKYRADRLFDLGRLEEAVAFYGAAMAGPLPDQEKLYAIQRRTLWHKAAGDWESIVEDMTTALQIREHDALLTERINAFLALGNLDGAGSDLTRLLELGVDDADNLTEVYRLRATIRQESGDASAALADYNAAIETNARPDILISRGNLLLTEGRTDDAASDFRAAANSENASQANKDLGQLGVAKAFHYGGSVEEAMAEYATFFAVLARDEPAAPEVQQAALALIEVIREHGHYEGQVRSYDENLRGALRACIVDEQCRP